MAKNFRNSYIIRRKRQSIFGMFGSYEYFGLSTTMRNMQKRKQTGIAIIKNELLFSTLLFRLLAAGEQNNLRPPW